MHASVLKWVQAVVGDYGLAGRHTLECGAFNVNGTPRMFFSGDYWGIDMREQPGFVDQVANANDIPFEDSQFEVVVTTEMLEHDPHPWQSCNEMARVLAPGGHLLLTTRGFHFSLHDYPSDYWRFSLDAIALLVHEAGLRIEQLCEDPEFSGVFCHAVK